MKKILSIILLLSVILSPATVLAASDNTTEETFYGYQSATYTKDNVKTDTNTESYTPWFRNVYKYNYDYKETFSKSNFSIYNTNAQSGTVWSIYLGGYHLTRFVSDIDMCRKSDWSNYYQPRVDVRDNGTTIFVGQQRSSNIQQNGTWTGDIYINGTLSMYAYGETGSGRNWTGSGGSNYIEYYKISSKVSDWVFVATEITGATNIGSIKEEGYVLPTWGDPKGWRSVTPYNKNTYTKPVDMKVVYHSNGGTGSMSINSSSKTTLSPNGYTKTGYTFGGWNTKADGTGVSIVDSASISTLNPTIDGELHLYATWKPISYIVSYDGNGGAGSMPKMPVVYDTYATLYANTFTKEGYLFKGWNTKQDATGTFYADKATIRNLGSISKEVVTLYAIWQLAEFKVSLNPNGGMIDGSSTTKVLSPNAKYGTSTWYEVPLASREGYEFMGYYTDKTDGDIVYDASGKGVNGTYWNNDICTFKNDLELFAHYKDITPPVITIKNYNPSLKNPDGSINYTNENVVVTFDVVDKGSGLAKVELVHNGVRVADLANFNGEKSAILNYTVSTRIMDTDNYYIRAYDIAGNVSYKKLVIDNIDKTKPDIDESEGFLNCNSVINGNGSLKLKVNDDYSGIREWKYKVDTQNSFNEISEGEWTSGDISLTADISVDKSTIANINVYAIDNAGNTNSITSCKVSFNKIYEAETVLSDYTYIFNLYDSRYGKNTAANDYIANDFLNYLDNDSNETSASAIRYIKTLINKGSSKKEALVTFMKVFK